MTNTTEFSGEYEHDMACRVAYIYGGEQPVLCTMIGDQPLFYADEVDVPEYEEDFLESTDDLLFKLTHQEIHDHVQALREKEQNLVDEFARDVYADFSNNFKGTTRDLEGTLETLAQSRLGSSLIEAVKAQGVSITPATDVAVTEYDRVSKAIRVNTNIDQGTMLVSLSQSLRQAYQHGNGVLINPMTFAPEDAIIVNRAQIADLCTVKVRVAWELKMAGETSAWEAVLNSALSDIAFTFAREVKKNFRHLNSGWAMQVAFEKWYLTDRCKIEDKRLIQMMLADHGGFVFESEELSQVVTLDVVTRMGDMPFGNNYLRSVATNVASDPLYSEIRDRSAANFLWFIKFESAFRDKEAELEASGELKKDELNPVDNSVNIERSFKGSPFIKNNINGARHEEERTGDVIDFAAFKRGYEGRASSKQCGTSGAVVSLFDAAGDE